MVAEACCLGLEQLTRPAVSPPPNTFGLGTCRFMKVTAQIFPERAEITFKTSKLRE